MTEQVSSGPQGETSEPAAPSDQEMSQESPKYPEKVRVKIEGREEEVPFERLITDYQTREVSTKRFQEASQMKKEMQNLFGRLSKKDKAAIDDIARHAGDEEAFREAVEEWLYEKIKYDNLSPVEKEYRKTKAERDEFAKKLKEKEEDEQKSLREQLRSKATEEIDKEVSEYLQSSKIKTPRLVARALETIQASLKTNGTRIPLKDAWKIAEEDTVRDVEAYVRDMDPDELKKLLGKEKLKALREADLEAVRSNLSPQRATPKDSGETRKKPKELSLDDYFKEKEKRYR
jgi:hypothetical protein